MKFRYSYKKNGVLILAKCCREMYGHVGVLRGGGGVHWLLCDDTITF